MPYTKKGECRNTGKTHFSIGYIPWNKNKSHSKETLEKLREIGRRKRPWQIAMKGKPWSEARQKAQEARMGKPYVRLKPYVRRKPYVRKLHLRKPLIKNGKAYPWFWNELRKLIYRRDNWTCQECGVKCHNTTKKKIQCHHMDYDEKNNDSSNLITLCASCHAKTNYRREDWILHFLDKPKRK